ncbi:MAG: homogentisate 1,2-dioxygenase [Gammaproteobacteria bacterium]|nr:homogentisate 1,2-dioxygenase [Gammaproteobacteria bacterium]
MKWITVPRVEGTASRQAHTNLPDGTYERELGREGFYGPATQMHHRHPPTSWSSVEGALQPHAFDALKLEQTSSCPLADGQLFSNSATQIRFVTLASSMQHLVRNADGDDVMFIHSGSAELFCDYGHLTVNTGDYVVFPRGTMWRLTVDEPLSALLIEASNGSYQLPDKGLVGQHAVFDPAMLDVPAIDEPFVAQQNDVEWQVRVKSRNQISTMTYPFNPLDATGWHGTLMPVRINCKDIRPLMSHRYHLPPSAHTTFVSQRFVVCTFVPRPFESDPDALNVPFFHSNDDYDELIFYHQGQFFSRDHIHSGMMTLHPRGIVHGPHPKALKHAPAKRGAMADEVAVMIDTRDALDISELAQSIEWASYVDSWK